MKRNGKLLLGLALAVSVAGCASTQPAGVQLEDTEIATKIEAKLAGDPEVSAFNVDVDVNEGVARLSGNVESENARREAVHHARTTEGVVRVIDDIQIGEGSVGERVDDTALTAKVKANLTGTNDLNPFNINVDVENGVVTLMGRVESQEKKDLAGRVAQETQGVVRVENRLEVGDLTEGEGDEG
jgi:osmotically-inducible protein OsmY